MSKNLASVLRSARLYAIVDMGYVRLGDEVRICQELIEGGADVIQLRAKGLPLDLVRQLGERLLPVCRDEDIPFIMNDFPDICSGIHADGVHVGQDDSEFVMGCWAKESRGLAGRSTHSLEQAVEAIRAEFDYIGFGPLYATSTKPGRPPIGLVDVAKVRALDPEFPVFCIGGVNERTVAEILEAGADRIVVVSALLQAADIVAATRCFKGLLQA